MPRLPLKFVDLLALEEALLSLEKKDARQARIVELRFFGGLSIEETATALGVSVATVNREWRLAKAWLLRELSSECTACGLPPHSVESLWLSVHHPPAFIS